MSNDTTTKIEELAQLVVTDASKPDVKLAERIEALKTLAPIYTALRRHQDKDDGDKDDNDFNSLRENIAAAQEPANGSAKVRHRSRHT